MKNSLCLFLLLTISLSTYAQRPLKPSDVKKLKNVSELSVSPDEKWIAYVLRSADTTKDGYDENIWMISVDGKENLQLTFSDEDESAPKWSPDGKWLAFLSSRYKAKDKTQVWVMHTKGGEAKQLTSLKTSISDFEWSPDSKKLLLVIRDQEVRPDSLKERPKNPIVIDRYQFKADVEGYLEHRHRQLYLYDIASKKLDTLTSGKYDHSGPVWSPDGKHIAFTSNRTTDPDRNTNTDIWVIDAQAGSKPRQLTTWVDFDRNPVWSPDGKYIAYLRSVSPEWDVYDEAMLAVVPFEGGDPVILSAKLDRPVTNPEWTKDGKAILGLVEDDRKRYIMKFDVASKTFSKITDEENSITVVKPLNDSKIVALISSPSTPSEIFAIENGKYNRLTFHHDAFLKPLILSKVKGFTFENRDKLMVGGLLYLPPHTLEAKKLPLILWIHGGPVAQDEFDFDLTPHMLSAQGYAVACINYRGSNGRGYAFSKAIYADWGNKEVTDLLDGVNYLIKTGVADPDHLGIGGWSYGGILTDYTTATDSRFKAAASGAGSALQITMYGTDQYIQQYESELGVPWKNMDKWMKLSYPFWKVEKIKTPTLYMVGENDFNVPAAGSEQMYQALRSIGVPTQLIIYPKQYHGIRVPSYLQDRYERYNAWFKQYMQVNVSPKTNVNTGSR
jgi:dipeptidyl aminopeptidase/acylaminoacyl peptidase